jgi:hypothetical protein
MDRLDPDARPTEPSSPAGATGPARVRFRAQGQPGRTETERRWQAAYSVGEDWGRFEISIDLGRGTCTLHRSPGSPPSALLEELAGQGASGATPVPPPTERADSLELDADVIGLKMPKVEPVADRAGGAGDWLVVQVYLPGSTESFLLGLNEHQGSGEIAVLKAEALTAVVRTLARVLG